MNENTKNNINRQNFAHMQQFLDKTEINATTAESSCILGRTFEETS